MGTGSLPGRRLRRLPHDPLVHAPVVRRQCRPGPDLRARDPSGCHLRFPRRSAVGPTPVAIGHDHGRPGSSRILHGPRRHSPRPRSEPQGRRISDGVSCRHFHVGLPERPAVPDPGPGERRSTEHRQRSDRHQPAGCPGARSSVGGSHGRHCRCRTRTVPQRRHFLVVSHIGLADRAGPRTHPPGGAKQISRRGHARNPLFVQRTAPASFNDRRGLGQRGGRIPGVDIRGARNRGGRGR